MKKLLLGLILCSFTISAAAKITTEDKEAALSRALSYLDAIHCGGEEASIKDVFIIQPGKDVDGDWEPKSLAVLIHTHTKGCSYGSGTSDSFLLKLSKYTPAIGFAIDDWERADTKESCDGDKNSLLSLLGISRGGLKVKQSKPGLLTVVSHQLDDSDSRNCPTLRYEYLIDLVNEKIVKKTFLGKKDLCSN